MPCGWRQAEPPPSPLPPFYGIRYSSAGQALQLQVPKELQVKQLYIRITQQCSRKAGRGDGEVRRHSTAATAALYDATGISCCRCSVYWSFITPAAPPPPPCACSAA